MPEKAIALAIAGLRPAKSGKCDGLFIQPLSKTCWKTTL